METVTVQGVEVPAVGLGTWELEGSDAYEAVRHGLEVGYRHVDTAAAYGNEEEVGRALGETELQREAYWVTTKVWHEDLEPGRLREAAEASLKRLDLDYVDLLLTHWPDPTGEVPLEQTLEALASLQEDGRIRHFGVSNVPVGMLRDALGMRDALGDKRLFCNQVELHPFLPQPKMQALTQGNDVLLAAYSPLAHGKAVDDQVLREVGERHGVSAAQVSLRWLLDLGGTCVLPRSSSPQNREANLALDFELTEEDRGRIGGLEHDRGERMINPPFAPDWDA